jgi:hypothetical protein
MTQNDGLLFLPYTTHDWAVVIISVLGTVFRLHLVTINKDNRQKITFTEYINAICISGIMTLGLYELAISKQWKIEQLYIPFALIIISSKVIIDWLFMSKDGKIFIISTFKMFIETLLKNFGYEKNNTTSDNPSAD